MCEVKTFILRNFFPGIILIKMQTCNYMLINYSLSSSKRRDAALLNQASLRVTSLEIVSSLTLMSQLAALLSVTGLRCWYQSVPGIKIVWLWSMKCCVTRWVGGCRLGCYQFPGMCGRFGWRNQKWDDTQNRIRYIVLTVFSFTWQEDMFFFSFTWVQRRIMAKINWRR